MIRPAHTSDIPSVADLASKMWSACADELAPEFEALISNPDAAIFVCTADEADGRIIGFAQCQLRYDYVEGTSSSPVGYLEGIFVEENYRRCGYAKQLAAACEQWAREKGCTEFASDCELGNAESIAFHLHSGFEEANRIVCFAKKL